MSSCSFTHLNVPCPLKRGGMFQGISNVQRTLVFGQTTVLPVLPSTEVAYSYLWYVSMYVCMYVCTELTILEF